MELVIWTFACIGMAVTGGSLGAGIVYSFYKIQKVIKNKKALKARGE